jgi:hypothetical protein
MFRRNNASIVIETRNLLLAAFMLGLLFESKKKKVIWSSETSLVSYRSTRRYDTEEYILQDFT